MDPAATPPPGRKIHPTLENPIDNVIIASVDATMPFFRATGHTPNALTAYSGVLAALAVWQLYRGNLAAFSVAWLASYWFDCADGHFARTYGMETRLGDLLDHIKDVSSNVAVALVLWYKYRLPRWIIAAVLVFWSLALVHMGCQQKYYAQHLGANSGETLDTLQMLCPADDAAAALPVTRYVGVGTAQVASIIALWLASPR